MFGWEETGVVEQQEAVNREWQVCKVSRTAGCGVLNTFCSNKKSEMCYVVGMSVGRDGE